MLTGQTPLLTAEASAHIARRPGGGGSKKPHPHTKPNSTASPQHGPVDAHTSHDAPAVAGFGIPDAIGGPGLAPGARWRPAQCRIRVLQVPAARPGQGTGSVTRTLAATRLRG